MIILPSDDVAGFELCNRLSPRGGFCGSSSAGHRGGSHDNNVCPPIWALGPEGCHFLVTRSKPIEFSGPAGGSDFRLYEPTKNRANIYLSNIYGSESCGWTASASHDWVTLSQSSGTLKGQDGPGEYGEDTHITVSINSRASGLPRGRHEAEITIRSPNARGKFKSHEVPVILYARTPCDLQVVGGNYSGRAIRGSVPPLPSIAKLTNAGDAPCHWEAHSDRAWLTISPASGTVGGRSVGQFTIKANAGAAQLVPRDYDATVILTWSETGPETLQIEAKLEIDAPPCELYFAPGQTFKAAGKAGSEAFSPTHQTFRLENRGGTSCLYWQANHTAPWLSVPDETTVYPGSDTPALVEVDQEAAAQIRPGTYSAIISFGAGNQTAEHGIDAQLVVEALPCHLEIVEEELRFRIEPEGLLQSESEKPITLRNNWTNSECHWQVDSRRDWLTTEPASGILAGGEEVAVSAKLLSSRALSQLEAGDHLADLGFTVAEGTFDDPVEVTVAIDCKPGEPCAYLHATHSKTEVRKPVQISLAVYNPLETNIIAQLQLVVPTGWEVESDAFAERCSSICNSTSSLPPGGNQDFIELNATPNDEGTFEFRGNVDWKPSTGTDANGNELRDEIKTSPLKLKIAVTGPSTAIVPTTAETRTTPQVVPTGTPLPTPTAAPPLSPTPTSAPEPLAKAQVQVPLGAGTSPGQQSTPARPDGNEGPQQFGISSHWPMLLIAIGVIAAIAVIAGAILFGFKMLADAQRSTPPPEPARETTAS